MTPWRVLPPESAGTKGDLSDLCASKCDLTNLIITNMIVNSLELFESHETGKIPAGHDSFGATRTITSTRLTRVPVGAAGIRANST